MSLLHSFPTHIHAHRLCPPFASRNCRGVRSDERPRAAVRSRCETIFRKLRVLAAGNIFINFLPVLYEQTGGRVAPDEDGNGDARRRKTGRGTGRREARILWYFGKFKVAERDGLSTSFALSPFSHAIRDSAARPEIGFARFEFRCETFFHCDAHVTAEEGRRGQKNTTLRGLQETAKPWKSEGVSTPLDLFLLLTLLLVTPRSPSFVFALFFDLVFRGNSPLARLVLRFTTLRDVSYQ